MIFSTFVSVLGWLIIPVGLFMGLLGYRMYRLVLIFVGIFIGFMLGQRLSGLGPSPELIIFLGVIVGITLGVLAHFFLKVSLYLLGIAGGWLAATMILPLTQVPPESLDAILWSAGAALLGLLLTRVLYKPLIVILTSFIGTFLVYTGTSRSEFFPSNPPDWIWVPYAVLILIFIIVQLRQVRHHNPMAGVI